MAATFDPDGPAGVDSGVFGLPHTSIEAQVHVIGVPFDATTSYRKGAAHGPQSVFAASRQVDLFDLDFGSPFRAGIHMLPIDARIEELNAEATECIHAHSSGDRVNAIGAELNEIVRAQTASSLDENKLVAVLGGDHSVPFGAIQACAQHHPGLGILHFDAHADLREAYDGHEWSHASILFNVMERIANVSTLVQCGIRDLSGAEHELILSSDRIHTLFDRDWQRARSEGRSLRELVRRTLAPLPEQVWVSFDIDGLDPALCPNTGTPVPGGFDWHATIVWLEELATSGRRVVGLDLTEVSPGPGGDPDGVGWDAIVGARLLYKLIGAALVSRDPTNSPIH